MVMKIPRMEMGYPPAILYHHSIITKQKHHKVNEIDNLL